MSNERTSILFPVGRMVAGNLYTPNTTDAEGRPLVTKSGPDAGKPRVDYFFAVAIPKAGEPHWNQTPWGAAIWNAGAAAFPVPHQAPTFAWKVADGDSQIPDLKGRKNADKEGWKGCWIVKFSGSFAPKLHTQPSPGAFVDVSSQKDLIKPGYHVVVSGSVSGNGSALKPGVFVNHNAILLSREDAVISFGPDAATLFAGQAVTQGAAAQATAVPFAPAAPAATATPTAPTVVAPNPAFLQAPAVPMAPPVPPVPPAVPAEPVMTPKGVASGFTYAQYRANQWTDDVLRHEGLIV